MVKVYRLIMFYLVRSEASYQSFTGSIYGLICFYNKCVLIKVSPKVHCDGIITVQKETLEGSNIGEFGEKPSIHQFLNHQCFPIY